MRARRLLLPLLLVAAVSLPPAAALQAAPSRPVTYEGTLRYSVQGAAASPDGIAQAMLVSTISAPVALARLYQGLPRVFSQLPSLAGAKDADEFLRAGINVDTSGIPVRASYNGFIDFVLEQAADGSFKLLSGNVRWDTDNTTRLDYDSGSLEDNFHGQGSEPLDPAADAITLVFDFKAETPTFDLKVAIDHDIPMQGRTSWTFLGGVGSIWCEVNGGHEVCGGNCCGEVGEPSTTDGPPDTWSISYSHKGPIHTMQHGSETWRNLLDAQVVARWEVTDECSATIDEPAEGDTLTYEEDSPGVIDRFVAGKTVPSAWAGDLVWTFPDISGAELVTDPTDPAKGMMVGFTYTGMPSENSGFGNKEFEASFDTVEGTCEDPEPRQARVLFPRDAKNNPGGSEPNWFYYWSQTSAAQGHEANIVYLGPSCRPTWMGYFSLATDPGNIHLCESARLEDSNSVTGRYTEGIDTFASTVRHEWQHLTDLTGWWPDGYDPARDSDGDQIPNDLEESLGFDDTMFDTYASGFNDLEVRAYTAEDEWALGTADSEDWANPGKQSATP
ncbi:MAG: hypothetical protein ACYC5O_07505 [Anaerolineae bacterium]